MTTRDKKTKFWHGVPPWLIIGSVIILLPIFILWTIDNIHRQKETTILLLLEKGAALIRSFEAGTRTGMLGMMGMRGTGFKLQRLLIETAKLPDIKYIMVIDNNGTITAHSNPGRIGEIYKGLLPIRDTAFSKELQWRQLRDSTGEDIFELYRRFSPRLVYSRTRMGKRIIDRDILNSIQIGDNQPEKEQAIFVGLEMTQIEEARKEDVQHTMIMAAIFLLVCLGGISFLFLVQAYRTTKSSLKRIKAFSDNVVDNMPIGLIALDPDKRIVSFNNTAEKILKKDPSYVIGKSADTVIPPEVMDILKDGDESKRNIEREINYQTQEGRKLTLEMSASILESDNRAFLGHIILFRDITEIRSLQKEVERGKRLASIGGLAAGVAHEIRNPLSSIKGFATYFSERYNHIPEDKKTADIMIKEVDRLNRVIGQLLEFAKPMNIEKRPVYIRTLIQGSVKLIERDADKNNIRINIGDIPSDLAPVEIDPDRLNQVLLNLYLNAIEAMPNGGVLTIEAFRESDYRMLGITVTDTGRGIDKKDLAHVFDPYFTKKQSGTGLGLSIVHRIIESHNGEVTIESELGKGTTVMVFLPYT